jgi:hypothetical protein
MDLGLSLSLPALLMRGGGGQSPVAAFFADGTDGFFLPSTAVFQDAEMLVPAVNDGDGAFVIKDMSGRGRDGIQPSIAGRPKLYTVNGKRCIRYDGADDRMPSTIIPALAATVALKVKVNSPQNYLFGSQDATTRFRVQVDAAGSMRLASGTGTGTYGATDALVNPGVFLGTSDGTTTRCYWNGVQISETSHLGGITSPVAVIIGGVSVNGSAQAYTGADIYAALFGNKAVGAADAAALSAYIATNH